MPCFSLSVDLDLTANVEEVGRPKIEQIDRSNRVAEQEGEKRQTPPQQPSARLATHDFVVGAEVDGMVEIDRAAEVFCRTQRGRQIGYFDKAVVDGQVPEAFK